MTGETFDRFVRAHERMVRALAYSYVREDHSADDVMQEAFLRAYRSIEGLNDPTKVKTWLYTLTRNIAIDHLRARKNMVSIEEHNLDAPTPAVQEGDDRIDRIIEAIDGLREDYRQIILLRFVDKMSYRAIAEILDMTTSAVGEKLHRVRNMIASKL